MPVLSAADRAFWEEHGYVTVHDAVPPENTKAAEDAVWNFLGMDAGDRESWYPDPAAFRYHGGDIPASSAVGQSPIPARASSLR